MKNKNLIGSIINGLNIINYHITDNRQFFECICICGKIFKARTESIKAGTTKSCGCLRGDLVSKKNSLPNNLGALKLIYRYYEHNASKRKLEFLLSLEEFSKLVFNKCNYCGIEPQLSVLGINTKNRRPKEIYYNGIDRIDNSIGYKINNCVSCCSICNAAKSDLSNVEFHNWIKRLVSFNNGK